MNVILLGVVMTVTVKGNGVFLFKRCTLNYVVVRFLKIACFSILYVRLRCDSSDRAPSLQVQSPEFKPTPTKKIINFMYLNTL
jgi:hypothetical protein